MSTAAGPDGPVPPYELRWPGKFADPPPQGVPLRLTDAFDGPAGAAPLGEGRNRLLEGDNLACMAALLPELRGRIDLVYLDPPFNAGQEFTASVPLGDGRGMGADRDAVAVVPVYRDVWREPAYLQMLYERLLLVRELLAPTGSLLVHVNWRVGHLVQLLLDEVLGAGERQGPGRPGFRNEIVWGFGGGGAARSTYRRKHDNVFWYTRSDTWTFNLQYRPYTAKTRQRGLTAVKGDRYELRDEGASLETWWTDADVQKILSPTAAENLKFPTQKPEALLERVLLGHSRPGDLVADFFCGSGTTGAVAERLGRRWILADRSRHAVHTTRKRLAALQERLAGAGEPYRAFDLFRTVPDETADGEPPLSAAVVYHADGSLDVRLLDFEPQLPASAPEALRERALRDGFDFLDAWSVHFGADTAANGVFRHHWQATRGPRSRKLPLESTARWPHKTTQVAVKAIDVFGNETLAILSV
jgi:DNA modification methylase